MPSFDKTIDLDWEPAVLEAKTRSIRRDAAISLVVGLAGVPFGLFFLFLFGLFFIIFFGAIVGAYAISKARDALVDINVYGVGREYKWVARAAQLLGGFSILWPLVLTTLFFVGRLR
ncbi:MAG TPA: hypothetical protein VF297_27500 [Pyrinomonadaceae bacterium]